MLCSNVHVCRRPRKQSEFSGWSQRLVGGVATWSPARSLYWGWTAGHSHCCWFSCIVIGPQPSTLPQGTVNMNLCTDISDAEPRTGQKNAVCIVTPEQEIFIRGDNKEIISG